MNVLHWLVEQFWWLLDLRKPENLRTIAQPGGHAWIGYLILFAIIFSETGLLIGFFLPGDSLLFAAGFLASNASKHVFDIFLLNLTLMAAAILGDAVNYRLGLTMEEKVFERGHFRFVKHEHLMAAKAFYERHGGKAIVLARFMPLVRTFTPFVAGIARMGYRRFAAYNIIGGVAWVASMTLAGYWLGEIPWVGKNFEKAVIAIVLVSISPLVIGGLRAWLRRRRAKSDVASSDWGDQAEAPRDANPHAAPSHRAPPASHDEAHPRP
jgi:membrane-associated protein